jgi:hypothetical protein
MSTPTSNLRAEEQEAERILRDDLGLQVSRVQTTTSKTPDFLVDGDGRGYVVEVKAREDSDEWASAINSGKVARQKRSAVYGRWTEDQARKAVKQFRSLDVQHSRWWILWLAIKCVASANAMAQQVIGTLFGVRHAIYCDSQSTQPISRDCLFARPGVFERHPEIVASVVDLDDAFCLCVNEEFAQDFTSFQQSALWSRLVPTTATKLAEKHGWFRVDYLSVNRKDDSAIRAFLEKAYKLRGPVLLVDSEVDSASIAHR